MKKLKALLLTEGMHGMISQVEGMAKALNAEYEHKIIRLKFPWNLIPPKFSPISRIVLKDKTYITEDKDFDLVISCGRKSIIPSILIKKKRPKIFAIHVQDPKIKFKYFDAIVAPEHDRLVGDNVYNSKGAIHYITELEINKAKTYLNSKISSTKIVTLILGGPNKYYSFDKEQLLNIFNEIKSKFISDGYKVIVIPSIRTPKEIIEFAIQEMKGCGYVANAVNKQAYLSSYALADFVVVTCDSTSMISEAAVSGKPIFIAHMKPKKNNYRFKRFFKLFREKGITRDLGEPVGSWTYNKLNEAERIAIAIKKRINI